MSALLLIRLVAAKVSLSGLKRLEEEGSILVGSFLSKVASLYVLLTHDCAIDLLGKCYSSALIQVLSNGAPLQISVSQ